MKLASLATFFSALLMLQSAWMCEGEAKQAASRRPAATTGGAVYPQCLYQGKLTARWIPQQMPLKVWVSHGLTMDQIIDPASGAPVTNRSNTAHWGDAVIQVLESGQINTLPIVAPYTEQMYQLAVNGMSSWKPLEREGLFSYEFTDNPDEADVYVFWTNHFVNKQGLGLFENDVRGETSKWLLPAEAVLAAMQNNDLEKIRRSRKPVVVLLRTTASDGQNILAPRDLQASAAHEMGHVLGIDGHSPNPRDLMSVYYAQGQPNPTPGANDMATMRYLYRRPANMIP